MIGPCYAGLMCGRDDHNPSLSSVIFLIYF